MTFQLITKMSEVKLVEALNSIEDFSSHQAVHFRFEKLLEEYKSDYHIKIAINLINDLLKIYSGTIYVLSNRGMVIMARGVPQTLMNKLIFQLRYLYTDDPLAYTDDGRENPDFCLYYDLETDRGAFVEFVSKCMAKTVRKTSAAQESSSEPGTGKTVIDLSASRLADIEVLLRQAELSECIRKQPVCALISGQLKPVFDEIYIHIAHLRQQLRSDIDFLSSRWLFKHLTHILDERMLELVRKVPENYFATPVSLNLNVGTLLSSAFTQFDMAIPAAIKVSIVIEIPVVDVFADMTAFMIAKDEVQRQGYRVCLDGMTARGLMHIDREKLGVDLVKLQWNADVQSDLQSKENQELMQAVQRCGPKRIILCRCDGKQAVDYGQALGIALFQGRYIDALRNPSARIAS